MPTIPDKFLIPTELKKTRKHTKEDYEQVKYMHKNGISIHQIAEDTGISRRMIQFTLYPERLQHAKKLFAERQKTGRYRYTTEKQTRLVRDVRNRKRELLKDNKLILKVI